MTAASAEEMYSQMLFPGAVWLTSGFRGGGKSHTAIAVAEQLVKGKFPSLGKVFVLTNIIFYHKLGNGSLRVETPNGVYHVETMKDTFWKIYEILKENGTDVTILLILDEAQNFIAGDSNSSNASAMMKEFLGTIRKFRLAVWFLCPSKQSIGPAFRNWINDEKYPGNLTAEWKKDLKWNARYVAKNHLKDSPKAFIFAKNYNWKNPKVVKVPVTEWTQTKEGMKAGEFCYDHEASATFRVGDDFDWEDFNRVLGGTASINLLPAIERYYAGMAKKIEEEQSAEDVTEVLLDVAVRIKDETDLPWKKIADIIGMPRNTLTDRLKSTGRWNDDRAKNIKKNPSKTGENSEKPKFGVRQNEGVPRRDDDGRNRGRKNPAIYISKETAEKGGFEDPVFVDSDDDEDPMIDDSPRTLKTISEDYEEEAR